MELSQQALIIDGLHEILKDYLGKSINLTVNLGRGKKAVFDAKLINLYSRLFVVEVEYKRGRTIRQSYQFVDILTGVIIIKYEDKPIFVSFVTQDKPAAYGEASESLEMSGAVEIINDDDLYENDIADEVDSIESDDNDSSE